MIDRRPRIYLDDNASAPLLPEARLALVDALNLAGNPSSVHWEGRAARAVVEDARHAVASLVGADGENLVFTSGATEAAVTCLTPNWFADGAPISLMGLAVSEADHAATRDGGRFREDMIRRLPVDASGQVRLDALEDWLGALGADAGMLCLTLANSETGVIQRLAPIIERLRPTNVIFVLDVVQAAGRMRLDLGDLGVDAVLLSGHKIGAAKGVGAYILKSEARRPAPLLTGGGQEKRHRAGTEAVPLIASFGAAARVARARLEDAASLKALRDRLIAHLQASGLDLRVVGAEAERLPNTVAVAAVGVRAETAQIALDLDGFAISSGSACSSGRVGPSHVLTAMRDGGLEIDPSLGAIRVSIGYDTTEAEIDLFAEAFLRHLSGSQQGKACLQAA